MTKGRRSRVVAAAVVSVRSLPNPAVQNALDVVLRLLGKMDEVPREFVEAKASESVSSR